ncbi:MAG: hypothetical protein ACREMA_10875, partial [Longimicrobiales bacterium]
MDLTAALRITAEYLLGETWIVQVFLVVFATLLADWTQKRVLRRLHRRMEAGRSGWDTTLLDALRGPPGALIWVVGIAFAAEIMRKESGAAIFGAVRPLRDVGVVLILAWFLIRFIQRAERNIVQ